MYSLSGRFFINESSNFSNRIIARIFPRFGEFRFSFLAHVYARGTQSERGGERNRDDYSYCVRSRKRFVQPIRPRRYTIITRDNVITFVQRPARRPAAEFREKKFLPRTPRKLGVAPRIRWHRRFKKYIRVYTLREENVILLGCRKKKTKIRQNTKRWKSFASALEEIKECLSRWPVINSIAFFQYIYIYV